MAVRDRKTVPERYFVTDGEATVGPVDGELLARGIKTGKVPLDALVWATGWEKWRPVTEFAEQIGVLPERDLERSASRLARVSDLYPLQLPSTDVQCQSLRDAQSLTEAAIQFLNLTAGVTGAEGGWVHVASPSLGGALITAEGLGPRVDFGIGRTIEPSDQALRAARAGRTVLGEPIPGVVGSAVAARILSAGISPTSVLMTPVLCEGRLLVMLELGIASRESGFSAKDAAMTEQMAADFSAVALERRWAG